MRISDWSSDVCSSDLLVREIMAAAEALIVQPVGRTIGRRRDRAAADGTGNHFCREMIDRHSGNPFTAKRARRHDRSEEHTSELQSLMRISYAVFCLKKKTIENN